MSTEHDNQASDHLQREADRAKPRQRVSVLGYITILFAAAFLLLLLSYFMQQRNNEEVISGLKESVSAMQSIENLQTEKAALADRVETLETQNALLESDGQAQRDNVTRLTNSLSQKEKQAQATDWLRQIQALYAADYYKAARKLISEFQETGLVSFLSTESVVPGKPSPSEDYATIIDALY